MARDSSVTSDPKFDEGFSSALRDVAAHCRQGDFLPGGVLYEDEVEGRIR